MVKPKAPAALQSGARGLPEERSESAPVPVWGEAWTTALGSDIGQVWQRLLNGETGFSQVGDAFRLRNDLAAVIGENGSNEDARNVSQRLRALASTTIVRSLDSLAGHSGLPAIDLVIGTSLGDFLETGSAGQPLHDWARDVARDAGLTGQVVSLSTACSSSADAILVAAELIRSGASQACVCGGADVVSSVKRQGHSGLGTLSPTKLRPFDQEHDGTLLGEGAAFLLLVSTELQEQLLQESAAKPSGKPSRACSIWLRGVGSANDGASMSGPDPEGRGARFAIERSLADAGLTPETIDVINAHGSGTPLNDETEIATYTRLFGTAHPVQIFATKGAFGHTLGATGSMEAMAVIQALRTGWIPPIAGLEQPVQEAEAMHLPLGKPRKLQAKPRYGLSLTLGFGGFDTSLIFEVQP